MKLYICSHCQNRLYFENSVCLVCNHVVGFDAASLSMITLEVVEAPASAGVGTGRGNAGGGQTGKIAAGGAGKPGVVTAGGSPGGVTGAGGPAVETAGAGAGGVTGAGDPGVATTGGSPGGEEPVALYADIIKRKKIYRFCENAQHGTCNWLIPAGSESSFCQACALNNIIPALSNPENLDRWRRIEVAKHRLIYSLLRLQLPVAPRTAEGGEGIEFDFMADLSPDQRIMTGHNEGVITLNIEEADEAERVRNKLDLGEKYRTLLGHFRHEIGHYYWDILIRDKPLTEAYRKIFGDEQKDYQEALKIYYQNGAPLDWMDHFISPYASSHPWEDWAETWAHYMHLMDTVETAFSFGLSIHPGKVPDMEAEISKDPYAIKDFDRIINMWLPLTFAVNSLNRSMGHADFYPFVISPAVIEKLRFIHQAVKEQGKK